MAVPRVRLFQYFRFIYNFCSITFLKIFFGGPFFDIKAIFFLEKIDDFGKIKGRGKACVPKIGSGS